MPLPQRLVTTNPLSVAKDLPTLDSRQLMYMNPYNMWPLVSGLLHSAYVKGPSTLRHVPVLQSLLRLTNSPLYGCTTFGLLLSGGEHAGAAHWGHCE